MFPQVLSIHFKQHWSFRKVQIVADGVDCVSMLARSTGNNSVSATGDSRLTQNLERFSNIFIFDVKQGDPADKDAFWGNQLRFTFTDAFDDFVSVLGVQVTAVPYNAPDNSTNGVGTGGSGGGGSSSMGRDAGNKRISHIRPEDKGAK